MKSDYFGLSLQQKNNEGYNPLGIYMKKDRYLNLDVEFLPSKKDTWSVEEKTYGVTFSQENHVKTRVEIVMKGHDRTKHYVQFYENDELKYEMCFADSILISEAMLAIHDLAERRDGDEINEINAIYTTCSTPGPDFLDYDD